MDWYWRAQEGSQSDPTLEWTDPGPETRLKESCYLDRPDEVDCLRYLRTGSCGYGARCRYNHLRDRTALTIVFTPALLVNLNGLEQLTVDDCAMITSLVSCNDSEHAEVDFLPNLKKISLHFLPELTSFSSCLRISARPEWMSFYCCPNLKNLPISKELNGDLQKIKCERSFWEDLEWGSSQQQCWDDILVPVDECD